MDVKSKEKPASNPVMRGQSKHSVELDKKFLSNSTEGMNSLGGKDHVLIAGTGVNCIKIKKVKGDVSKNRINRIEPNDKVASLSDRSDFVLSQDDGGCAMSPCFPAKQSNHLSAQVSGVSGEKNKDLSVLVNQQILEIVPNGSCSESSGNYAISSSSSSKLDSSPLSCISIDKLFDPVLITPSGSFLKVPDGQFSKDVSPSFKSVPVEGHDVCQKLLDEVLELEHDKNLGSLQMHALEAETLKSRCAAGLTDLDSDSNVGSELPLNTQGFKDCCSTLTVAKIQTLNGISAHVHSSKSEVSQATIVMGKSNTQQYSVVKDSSQLLDFEKSSSCDSKAVQNISRYNNIAEETIATQNSSTVRVPYSLSSGDHSRHVLRATKSEKENAQRTKPVANSVSYDRQTCLTVTQTSDLEKLSKTNMDDISSKLIKGKAPKAKKSCVISAKVPDVYSENSEFSVLRRRMEDDSTPIANVTEDAPLFGNNSRPALSAMTIKLPELENVLGIGYKSLDKMDAKTLDRIVLAKAQKKQKLEANSQFESFESSNRSSFSRNFSDKDRPENLHPICTNETMSGTETQKHVHLFEKINDQPLPPVSASHADRSSPAVKDLKYSVTRNCSSGNTNTDQTVEPSTVKGCGDDKISRISSGKAVAESKVSDQVNLDTLTFIRRPVCKARKSQGYAFGHVRRRDVLSASSPSFQSPPDLGSTTKMPDSTLASEVYLNPAKEANSTNQNKAKKQATSYQPSLVTKNTENSPSEKSCESSGRRLGHKRKEFGQSLTPDFHCPEPKQMLLSSAVQSVSCQRPVKSSVSRHSSVAADSSEEQLQPEIASVSMSSLPVSCAAKLPQRSIDKISLPVTPPRSPDGCFTHDASSSSLLSSVFTLKCCCEKTFSLENKNLQLCQALDSVDGKVVGCNNKWTNGKLVRASTRIPFMAVCEKHFELLTNHRCCPRCGLFCVQGEFYQCKQSPCGKLHTFHRHCQVFRDNRYLCPHCGKESAPECVVLQMDHSLTVLAKDGIAYNHSSKFSRTARLCSHSTRKGPKSESSKSDCLNDELLLFSINQGQLEMMLSGLSAAAKEKLKKIRVCAKSFFAACKNGELDRVIYMIGEGIDPNIQSEDYSESYLHVAARNGHQDVVKLLLQAGSLPNLLDIRLHTPLMVAAIKGHQKVLEVLIRAGASSSYRTTDGMTVLHLAAKAGQLDVIRFLVENSRLDVNVKDDGGWTPVIWATEYTHVTTVKYLLKMRANPNIQDNELNSGLHWAAYAGSTDISTMFLDAGCDLESSNERGDRPLHIAARQDHYECVSMFLMRGADATAVNRDGQTPLDCCVKDSSAHMNLTLMKLLSESPAFHPVRPERLVHEDVSLGRESNPITIVNGVDDAGFPTDFLYVSDYVETIPININRVITSLRTCDCKDDCMDFNCNCLRSSIKCWYDKNGRLIEEFSFQDPPLLYECNRACRCYANCQNRIIQNGITCRLQVFRTKGRGWGCRTLLNIAKGSFVCEYFGELISDAEADRRLDDSYLFDLDNQETDTFCVDAAKYGNVSRFINHLCEPNITAVKVFVDHQDLRFPRMCFFANRDIKANEELGFDYGDKFWVIKYKDFTCDCGSSKCRYSVNTIGKTLEDFNRRQDEDTGHVTTTTV